jgi:phospholipid-binding lipoprotein MlaA
MRYWHIIYTLAASVALAGCAVDDSTQLAPLANDPYEADNRATHEFNKRVDSAFLRPVSNAEGAVIPEPVRIGVSNFASNAELPGMVVNNVLQFKIDDALNNTFRFLINTTIGIGGIFDPARAMKIEARTTDFGETLHIYGAREGNYMELPFLGPSTERDALGMIVDTLMDPVRLVFPKDYAKAATVASLANKVGSRYTFGATVDSVLYDSSDSYAQTRILYLENRRFELGETSEDDYFDPYAE